MLPPSAQLRRLGAVVPAPEDADLLRRFVADRDEPAFEELLRRHGPSVMCVCRTMTGDPHDADDAFQATFLVLARKANRVHPAAMLGAWLFGVAVRAGRAARSRSARIRSRETNVSVMPDVAASTTEPADPETVQAVLEEVAKLSDPYRSAVILCELEGRPRTAAARALGIPEGTLSSRLAAARKILAARLRRRGVTASVVSLAFSSSVSAVSADQSRRALAAALGSAPAAITTLSNGVIKDMTKRFFTVSLALVVLAMGALAVRVVVAMNPASLPSAPAGAAATESPAASKATTDGWLLLWCGGEPVILRPDGTGLQDLPPTGFQGASGSARFSPDGKRFAYACEEQPKPVGSPARYELYLRERDGKGLGARFAFQAHAVCWSADGKHLFGHQTVFEPGGLTFQNWEADSETGKRTTLPISRKHALLDRSPDGRHYLAIDSEVPDNRTPRLWLLRTDGSPVAPVSVERDTVSAARFSADGRMILVAVSRPQEEGKPVGPALQRVAMKDLADSTIDFLPSGTRVEDICGSPDGTKVAYTWWKDQPNGVPASKYEYHLTICDLQGENAKVLYTRKGTALGSVDWR